MYMQLISNIGFPYENWFVTTSLYPNAAIPGDIAQPFSLSGTYIGEGSFAFYDKACSDRVGCADGTLLSESIVVTADETPLPATLPLFTTGLGVLSLLGWNRRRKANHQPSLATALRERT
jgi:hypothetical protein